MSNTFKGAGDIYEDDLYGNIRKSGESFIDVLLLMNKLLAETSKVSGKLVDIEATDIKSVNDINKGIEQTNDLFQEKLKLDNKVLIAQKKINDGNKIDGKLLADIELKTRKLTAARNSLLKKQQDADKQRAIGNEQIANAIDLTTKEQAELAMLSVQLVLAKAERAEINKETKEQVKETLGLVDAYQRESKRLNELRKQLKNFILSGKEATQETEDLAREIDRLDKELKAADARVGQFQRNVGNYADALGDAGEETEEFAEETEDATADLIKMAVAVVAAQATFEGFTEAINDSAEGSEEFRKVTAAIEGGLGEAKNVVASTALDLFDLGKGLSDGSVNALDLLKSVGFARLGLTDLDKSATNINKTFGRTVEATDDFAQKVLDAAAAEVEAEERTIAFEKAVRALEIQISKINKVIAVQSLIAGDTTRSFNEIEKAAVKAQSAQEQRTAILIKIAQEELDIVRIRLNAQREAGRNVEDLLNQETDAIIKLQDLRTDAAVEAGETDKLLRENARDRFERELDFAIDAFDAQKTVNERRILNEKTNLEERRAIFDETTLLAEKSFRSSIKLVEDFTKQKLDFDALVNESDESVIRQKLRSFNFDDVTLGRILEIIKERKLALQDLTDTQVDLTNAEQDAIDVKKDIIAQEEALGKITTDNAKQSQDAIDDLEKDRESNLIANLRRRLDLAKEGSAEALQIQKDLNDALLDQQQKKLDEELEKEEEAAERRLEIQKASVDLLDRFSKDRSSKRLKELDKELKANEKVQNQLRASAAQGVLDADKSLAAEEKRQAQLELERQKEERRQELRTAGFKILTALLEQGKSPQEAIPEVGVLLGALPAVIEAIPTFYEGTEDTGKAKKALDSKGGRISILHDNERVVDKANNAKMGGVSNDAAADIVNRYNKGLLGDLHAYNQPQFDSVHNTHWQTNHQILEQFSELKNTVAESNNAVKKAIEDKPYLDEFKYNKIVNELTIIMKEGNKKIVTRSKPDSII